MQFRAAVPRGPGQHTVRMGPALLCRCTAVILTRYVSFRASSSSSPETNSRPASPRRRRRASRSAQTREGRARRARAVRCFTPVSGRAGARALRGAKDGRASRAPPWSQRNARRLLRGRGPAARRAPPPPRGAATSPPKSDAHDAATVGAPASPVWWLLPALPPPPGPAAAKSAIPRASAWREKKTKKRATSVAWLAMTDSAIWTSTDESAEYIAWRARRSWRGASGQGRCAVRLELRGAGADVAVKGEVKERAGALRAERSRRAAAPRRLLASLARNLRAAASVRRLRFIARLSCAPFSAAAAAPLEMARAPDASSAPPPPHTACIASLSARVALLTPAAPRSAPREDAPAPAPSTPSAAGHSGGSTVGAARCRSRARLERKKVTWGRFRCLRWWSGLWYGSS